MATSTQSTGGPTHIDPPTSSSTSEPSTIPIEMSDLEASKRTGAGSLLNDVSIPATSPISSSFPASNGALETTDENTKPGSESAAAAMVTSESEPPIESGIESATTASNPSQASPASNPSPVITRLDSAAIGPETMPTPIVGNDGPVLVITLLLTSGARHPYRIDEKYLNKRAVNVPETTESGSKDPFSISVYTLKELILREWREEWEAPPSSPSSIRLIYFGRLLDDKTALKECKFNADSANVIHMTVRPQDIVDEEDASKSKALARERDGGESTAGCRCVIL